MSGTPIEKVALDEFEQWRVSDAFEEQLSYADTAAARVAFVEGFKAAMVRYSVAFAAKGVRPPVEACQCDQ